MAELLMVIVSLIDLIALAYLINWKFKFQVAVEGLWNKAEILRRGHDDIFAQFKVIEAAHNQLVDELVHRKVID